MKRLFSYIGLAALASFGAFVPDAFAATEGGMGDLAKMGIGIAAGIGIGIAVGVAGIGQGIATASAVDGIARNPGAAAKIQTPMIIGLALIESLVIYALLIAFLLQGKI
ncbi:MAG: ATP synthase F0 subunit C [Candidatus Dadabacteria bacterium]|nr:ATP synthase F0 subunit C [Candidatus Dadabacteria bacterium]